MQVKDAESANTKRVRKFVAETAEYLLQGRDNSTGHHSGGHETGQVTSVSHRRYRARLALPTRALPCSASAFGTGAFRAASRVPVLAREIQLGVKIRLFQPLEGAEVCLAERAALEGAKQQRAVALRRVLGQRRFVRVAATITAGVVMATLWAWALA